MAASTPAASQGNRRRKTHNKSRNGCAQCKRRHYKVGLLHILPRLVETSPSVLGDMFTSIFLPFFRKLIGSCYLQCDEIYPTCSNCKRLETSCSLSTPNSPTDSDIVEKQLNIEDLQLLNDWHMGDKNLRFSDHIEEDSFREQRGREIELGFKHPYGKPN
jgi:hypothetical protein